MAKGVDRGRGGARPPSSVRGGWIGGILKGVTVLAVFVVFSGLIVYAYNKGKEAGGGGTPPIIRAGPAPYKLRPARPGGLQVPDRDKEIFSRLDGARDRAVVERLLPPPEKPLTPAPAAAPTAAAPLPAPSLASPQTAPGAVPRPADQAMAPAVATAPSAPAGPPKPAAKPAAPATHTAAAEAERVSKIAPASGGDYRIQIASLRSSEAVTRTWKRLAKANDDLLGGLALTVVRRDLGAGKGVYYRMQAGPLPDDVAARDLCARLKRRKIGCLVVRP